MSAQAIASLIDIFVDAHAVLCRGKVALQKGWQNLRPTPGDAWNHLNANPRNTVGVVPHSLGLTVMDVDAGPALLLANLAPPALVIPSRTAGHGHLWFPDAYPRANSRWDYRGAFVATGEIRSAAGFVVLWPGAAEAILYNVSHLPDHRLASIWDASEPALTYAEAEVVLWPDRGQKAMDFHPKTLPPQVEKVQEGRRRVLDVQGVADRASLYRTTLASVSAEHYEDWIGVGLALEGSVREGSIPESVARELWDDWAATSSKFNSQVQERRWRSFQGAQENPRTMGSYVVKRSN